MVLNYEDMDDIFINRFWSHVDVDEDIDKCWNWNMKTKWTSGYGAMNYKTASGFRKSNGSHRIAFMIYNKRSIIEGMAILHSCDNKLCCNPHHLSEGTNYDNAMDAIRKGRNTRGEQSHHAKIKEKDVIEIRRLFFEEGYSQNTLSEMFGVKPGHISRIVKGIKWKHVGGMTVNRNLRNKIQKEDVPTFRKLFETGVSIEELAEMYNMSVGHARDIINRKSWKDIP